MGCPTDGLSKKMERQLELAVAIPTYNRLENLQECVKKHITLKISIFARKNTTLLQSFIGSNFDTKCGALFCA